MTGNVVIIIAFPLFIFKPSLSGYSFFQPPCALALLLCAWRLFRALGCGGVGEVDYMSRGRCGAVASALLRQSRDTAEALSEMFLVAPCTLSEGRAQSLGLLQYSQHCRYDFYKGTRRMKLLDSNEIRQLRDVCVFEINGMEVFI